MKQGRVSQAERDRRAYWAQRRARERAESQQRESADPRHPHNHRCTERTIDYGTDEHRCLVCGRTWRLQEIVVGPVSAGQVIFRFTATPLTRKMPPYREETDRCPSSTNRRD